MGIFDGLPNPAAPAMAFRQGMQQGRAEREEREVRGALAAYATDPEDPEAFATIARWKPDLAIQIREDNTKRAQTAQLQDLTRRAAAGDRGARAQLAGFDIDTWDKLEDNDRQATSQRVEAIGNAAMDIARRPPEQRAAAWDSYIDQLSRNYPELAEYKGQYSEEALNAAISQAGMMQDFIKSGQPDYQVVPEGGTLVNTRDPAALAQVARQNAPAAPTSKAEYDALPPGAEYIAPDGTPRRKGGAGASRVGSNFLSGL